MTPTGRPAELRCSGTDIDGWPVPLQMAVKPPYLRKREMYSRWSSLFMSSQPSLAVVRASTGLMITSTFWWTRAMVSSVSLI